MKAVKKRGIDVEIVEQFYNGKTEAFTKIYEHYHRSIYFFDLKILKNTQDAEEAMQDTFVNVYKNIKALRSFDSFHSWIFTISYNCAQSKIVERNRDNNIMVQEGMDMDEVVSVEATQHQKVNEDELFAAVKNELHRMNPGFVEVGMLRYFEGLSVSEISDVLNIPQGTVKTRLKKIREQLQTKLDQQGFSPKHYFSVTTFGFLLFKELIAETVVATSTTPTLLMEVAKTSTVSSSVPVIKSAMKPKFMNESVVARGLLGIGALSSVLIYQATDTTPLKISAIEYYHKETNENIGVVVKMNQSIDSKAIHVKQDNKAIPYKIVNQNIVFTATENAKYSISVDEINRDIVIENIDKDAPVLEEVQYVNQILKLDIRADDVDYSKSNITNNTDVYSLPKSHMLEKQLAGDVYINIYDKVGNMVSYHIEVK